MTVSLHHEDFHKRTKCDKCICTKLRNLNCDTPVPVFVRTKAGGIKSSIKGTFIEYDPKTCCAKFKETILNEDMITFIDCRDIVSLSFTTQQFLDNIQDAMSDILEAIKQFGDTN